MIGKALCGHHIGRAFSAASATLGGSAFPAPGYSLPVTGLDPLPDYPSKYYFAKGYFVYTPAYGEEP